jgi:drug/metabolite transporter (DMT)-like permease
MLTRALAEVPWWAWTGGAQGAWYVLNVVIFAQPLGAATLTAVNVTASLAGAMVLDATGWIGFTKRSVQWQRVLGLLLMVVGVVLVSVYRGHEEEVAEVQLQLPGQPQLPPGPSVDLVVQSGSPLQAQAAPK